ncbi:MAG: hypothetical protein JXM69_03380 [Anaerolineae bacterium]|nr:hypothetical protein [Anaerolineae bacterium]
MKILTICFGIFLTLLGAVFYYQTGLVGEARYFPALVGILIVVFGLLQGRWEHQNPLYGSLLLAFLVFLGALLRFFRTDTAASLFTINLIIGLSTITYVGLGIFLIKDFWHGWKAFGQFLGNWLARVVLTIFYFTILVPFGLGVRLLADPLQIKKQPAELWRPRPTGDQKLEDVVRQF